MAFMMPGKLPNKKSEEESQDRDHVLQPPRATPNKKYLGSIT